MSNMSPVPKLSIGTRIKHIAEQLGFTGEGQIAIPVQSSDGAGLLNLIVTNSDLDEDRALQAAPVGTLVFKPSARSFFKRTEEAAWEGVDNNADVENLSVSMPSTSTPVVVPSLPKPPEGPIDDTSFIVSPSVRTGRASAASVKDANPSHLLHGSGNPSDNMVVASNGEISLAGACRVYRSSTAFAPEDGVYSINVFESEDKTKKDWTFVYSVALDNDTNGSLITDLYDVSIIVENMDTGRRMVYPLTFADGKFVMYDAVRDIRIDDNTVGRDGRVMQNVQRITFYAEKMHAEIGELSGSPIGSYMFKIRAVRKTGDFAPVECVWAAVVIDERPDDTSILIEPQVNVGAVLNPIALNATNPQNLKVGSSNRAQAMVVASNGEVELAGACRFYRSGNAFEPNGTEYEVNLQNSPDKTSKDWTFVYSAALVDNRNAAGLADLYDLTLDVRCIETGESLNFVGRFDNGVFHLEDAAHGLDIVDNTTDSTGRLMQNIQRINSYKPQLGNPSLGRISGNPIGEYEFTLTARRRVGEFPPVVAQWTASVIDEDLTMMRDPTLVLNAEPNDAAKGPDGYLKLGVGQPTHSMVVVSNGELEMAAVCRYHSNGTPIVPEIENGIPTYAFNVQDVQPLSGTVKSWNWTFALTLLSNRNGDGIDDLYDVHMIVKHKDNVLDFAGFFHKESGRYVFDSNGLSNPIVDSATDAVGSFVQNSQRVSFYMDSLHPTISDDAQAPIGLYEFRFVATRRSGNYPPMVLEFNAHVIDEADFALDA